MTILIDTRVLLWMISDAHQDRIPDEVRERFEAGLRRYVSGATAYEIAYKARAGRLEGGRAVIDAWSTVMSNLRLTEIPLSVAHMARAGSLDWEHRDPFDRMLVAQAQIENVELLTADKRIRRFDAVRTWWPDSRPKRSRRPRRGGGA